MTKEKTWKASYNKYISAYFTVKYSQEASKYLPWILLWGMCFQSSIKKSYSTKFCYRHKADILEMDIFGVIN